MVATTLDKNCGENKEFPLPPITNVLLGHADNNIETGGRVFFSEAGCVMHKNNVS